MSALQSITAPSTAEEILKGVSIASSAVSSAASQGKNYAVSYATPENGSYLLNVLFYLVLYLFILFLILLLIHFSIHPVFKFTPGSKGYIGVPALYDNQVYVDPLKSFDALGALQKNMPLPLPKDKIAEYKFVSGFSFSVDMYIRKITDDEAFAKRVIMYKAAVDSSGNTIPIDTLQVKTTLDMQNKMGENSAMYMYLNETNDLGFTVFSGTTTTPYSTREIKNIPLYKPFRVTVVVSKKSFTMYINAQQAFQRVVTSDIVLPLGQGENPQRFHFPFWQGSDKNITLRNFILWPRAITYNEVKTAQPALALESEFEIADETNTDKCNT
jgi:hypothetical protein